MIAEILGQLAPCHIPNKLAKQMDTHGSIGAEEILDMESVDEPKDLAYMECSGLTSATACDELIVVSGKLFSSSTYLVGKTNRS